jgi:regulatory protein YycI of two-component signal transduction system YycFG
MLFRTLTASALAGSLILCTSVTLAADKVQAKDQTQLRDQDPIYGNQLMTEQERIEHRNKMRSLKTKEEREAYRLEHHKKMQERAKERGVQLPDEPPARGGMMSPGGGMGPGGGGMMGSGGRK